MALPDIVRRLFFIYSTWVIRENDLKTTHSSVSTSESLSSWNTRDDLRSHHTYSTPSVVTTLQNSSLDINTPSETSGGDTFSHTTYSSRQSNVDKLRVIGRVDYEQCICDLLPKFSKSQCVTQACRLFDKVREQKQ